jgi:general L-amino acid transport system permease protein
MSASGIELTPPKVPFWNDPTVRSRLVQALMVLALAYIAYDIYVNASVNLARLNKTFGYEFWGRSSGFDISQSLIPYTNASSYGRAIVVGFLNTILVSIIGIFFATIIGFFMGIMRLSKNWLVAKLATIYVEVVRNVPLLLQIFIWYGAVLKPLPGPRQALDIGSFYTGNFGYLIGLAGIAATAWSGHAVWRAWGAGAWSLGARAGLGFMMILIGLLAFWVFSLIGFIFSGQIFAGGGGGMYLSNRGLSMPAPVFGPGAGLAFAGLAAGLAIAWWLRRWSLKRQAATGELFPYISTGLAIIVLLPLLGLTLAGWPLAFNYPVLGGFDFSGGATIVPEFMALLIALSIYTGAFIAEIVRAGIQAVSHGQTEAASALGVRPSLVTRLVVVPQALRIIIPPLASQYLNLTKNSSLAVAIAYPDLVAMGGTVLNQTGKAIEIVLIWIVVYLSLSLLTSAFMNWFNSRMRLVER